MNILRPNTARANDPAKTLKPAPEVPAPPAVSAATAMRNQRNLLLRQVDWMRDRHNDQAALGVTPTLTTDQHTQLLTYIQALRNVPQNSPNPAAPVWPTAPSFVPAPPAPPAPPALTTPKS